MIGGVYQIRNVQTGDRYVGRAISFARRCQEHRTLLRGGRHTSIYLQNAWNKYGEQAFVFEPLLLCLPDEAIRIEQKLLDRGTARYNLSRSAVSQVRAGEKRDPEIVKKIATANRGKRRTPEQCARMSAALTGRVSPRKGAILSAETREKIRVALAGRPIPAETRAKMSASRMGHAVSEATRQKLREAMLRRNQGL